MMVNFKIEAKVPEWTVHVYQNDKHLWSHAFEGKKKDFRVTENFFYYLKQLKDIHPYSLEIDTESKVAKVIYL